MPTTTPRRRRASRKPAMCSFIEEIERHRNAQGLTHVELAEKAGVTRAYLHRIIKGQQTPSMEIADKIAAALGLVITTAPAASSR